MSQRIGNQLEFDPVQPSNFHSSFQPQVKLFPFGLVSSLSGQRNRDGVSRSTVHHPLVSSDKISHTTFASRFLKNRPFLLSVTPNGGKVTYEWTDRLCDGRYFFFLLPSGDQRFDFKEDYTRFALYKISVLYSRT